MKEPFNLKEWHVDNGRLFTSGRPGRSAGNKLKAVTAETIDSWVSGLPLGNPLQIVSLLGSKTNGDSEFCYPFRSALEKGDKPTFQQWLDERYQTQFVIHEFPTQDKLPINSKILNEIVPCVLELLNANHVVLIVDSAGVQRTGAVRKSLGYEQLKSLSKDTK